MEREDLVWELQAWLDEAHHLHQQGVSSGRYNSAKVAEAEAKAEAARVALAAYDAEHPEEIAKIKAEREESTRRFLATD